MENININKSENEIVLHVWPGEWGLQSLDADCLTAMSYLKFTGLPHRIEQIKNPFLLLKNDYPKLIHNKKGISGLNGIVDYIKSIENIDKKLNNKNYADMLAFLNLFKIKFIPAFIELCWVDPNNTYHVTRTAYGKHVRFPMSVIKLKQLEMKAENFLKCNYKSQYVPTQDSLKSHIIAEAKECLNVLSSKLGEQTFMFENQPTLIDAMMFGYLSILYNAPFVSSTLKSHLNASTNLCSLVNRIKNVYFPMSQEEIEKKRIENEKLKNERNKSVDDASEESAIWKHVERRQVIAVSIAVASMLYFAFANDLIRIEISNTD